MYFAFKHLQSGFPQRSKTRTNVSLEDTMSSDSQESQIPAAASASSSSTTSTSVAAGVASNSKTVKGYALREKQAKKDRSFEEEMQKIARTIELRKQFGITKKRASKFVAEIKANEGGKFSADEIADATATWEQIKPLKSTHATQLEALYQHVSGILQKMTSQQAAEASIVSGQ